jgi:hypothetical protein
LRYSKDNDSVEVLEGTWIPAPNQTGDCGFGKTTLVRRTLTRRPLISEKKVYARAPKKSQPFKDLNQPSHSPATAKQKTTTLNQNKKPVILPKKSPITKNDDVAKNDVKVKSEIPLINPPVKNQDWL